MNTRKPARCKRGREVTSEALDAAPGRRARNQARLSQFTPGTRSNLPSRARALMNNLIYIVGLIVVVIAVLSFFGLR